MVQLFSAISSTQYVWFCSNKWLPERMSPPFTGYSQKIGKKTRNNEAEWKRTRPPKSGVPHKLQSYMCLFFLGPNFKHIGLCTLYRFKFKKVINYLKTILFTTIFTHCISSILCWIYFPQNAHLFFHSHPYLFLCLLDKFSSTFMLCIIWYIYIKPTKHKWEKMCGIIHLIWLPLVTSIFPIWCSTNR